MKCLLSLLLTLALGMWLVPGLGAAQPKPLDPDAKPDASGKKTTVIDVDKDGNATLPDGKKVNLVKPGGPKGPTIPGMATKKATKISPDAQKVLDQMIKAYRGLKTLEAAGTVSGSFDVAGSKTQREDTFSSLYQSPNKFRHENKDGLLMGSTGEVVYVFEKAENQFTRAAAPEGKVETAKWPKPVSNILEMSNFSLALALAKDPMLVMKENVAEIKKVADETIDGQTFAALEMTLQAEPVKAILLIDPKTNLLRQFRMDFQESIKKGGAPDVNDAKIVLDYRTISADVDIKPEQFNWTAPENATDVGTGLDVDVPGDPDQSQDAAKPSDVAGEPQPAAVAKVPAAGADLVGKAAPDFTLDSLAGEAVTLSDLSGKVVVLDFWATWCGPCVAAMPKMQALENDKDLKEKGLKILLVNLREDKAKVQEFIEKNKYTFTVLLDTKGAVAKDYGIRGIPTSVVIGRDGAVKKVFVGMNEEGLKAAINEAIKEEKPAK